jgi:hypothetical protein
VNRYGSLIAGPHYALNHLIAAAKERSSPVARWRESSSCGRWRRIQVYQEVLPAGFDCSHNSTEDSRALELAVANLRVGDLAAGQRWPKHGRCAKDRVAFRHAAQSFR